MARRILVENFLSKRNDPLKRLALEVIAQAVKDARAGDIEAAIWLGSEDAEPWCFLAGIHPGAVWRSLRESGVFAAIDIGRIMDLTIGPEERANAPQDLTQNTGETVIGLQSLYLMDPLPGGENTGISFLSQEDKEWIENLFRWKGRLQGSMSESDKEPIEIKPANQLIK